MSSFVVYGSISCQEIAEAIRNAYPDRKILINPLEIQSASDPETTINIIENTDHHLSQVLKKLEDKETELVNAEEAAKKAIVTIQKLNKQQEQLFNEFALLRQRYDEQKNLLVSSLWQYCTKYHPDLRQIPAMQDIHTYEETEDQIGTIQIGQTIGEGQFALVKACHYENKASIEYAIKVIRKERILSFQSLLRVANEIENLKNLKSPYVIALEQVIHTQEHLYIVTEKGGRDLFEFFDEHPKGVSETWAREIIACVLKGLLYCHDQGVCHRDLKPENILVTFDFATGKCKDLKLCDFGLSTKFKPKQLLTDFCGSPGFFCPEMIIHGSYFGDKADVWSVGCILLELMLGHERFCEVWMSTYDYEVLQDKSLFTKTIEKRMEDLPNQLNFSPELNDFILRLLELRSSRRPFVKVICSHGWLDGLLLEEVVNITAKNPRLEVGGGFTPPTLSPSPSFSNSSAPVSADILHAAYSNVSDRERKQLEVFASTHHNGDDPAIHLPPITPSTPNIGAAKKILRKGNELAHSAASYAEKHLPGSPDSHSYRSGRLPSLMESGEYDNKQDANRGYELENRLVGVVSMNSDNSMIAPEK